MINKKDSKTEEYLEYTYITTSDREGNFIGMCLEFPNLTVYDDSLENVYIRLISTIRNMIDVAKIMNEEDKLPKPINETPLPKIKNLITLIKS